MKGLLEITESKTNVDLTQYQDLAGTADVRNAIRLTAITHAMT